MIDLTVVWAFMIAFAVAAYVVMDGFDLGIGILFPFLRVGRERDRAISAIIPVWDGNETWLVFGGVGLLAAFPLAYSIILPALYVPLIAMLLGLVFRGVAFEFRGRNPGHIQYWDVAFCLGSAVATFMQGVTLGALLQGIEVKGRGYAGGWWDWLTPFSVLTGVSLIVGYALLGACWLVSKTTGPLQADARRFARRLTPSLLAAIGAVSLCTPLILPQYKARWFENPGLLVTVPMPLLVLATTFALWRSVDRGRDWQPFLLTLTLFLLSIIGLAISIWPDVVPGRVTIWEAASPHGSQLFLLAGGGVLFLLFVAYSAWAYWVFRGKVGEEGYH
jgi:cytochrome d ubiquinol oxidase subunit II